jgi:hypothetical protein
MWATSILGRENAMRSEMAWMTCFGGIVACTPGDGSDAGQDARTPTTLDAGGDAGAPAAPDVGGGGGQWLRCCVGDLAIPGIQSRGSGDSLECFCPAGVICNYGQCDRWDSGLFASDDAGLDAGLDAGFDDAGPIEDAAVDALLTDDARP